MVHVYKCEKPNKRCTWTTKMIWPSFSGQKHKNKIIYLFSCYQKPIIYFCLALYSPTHRNNTEQATMNTHTLGHFRGEDQLRQQSAGGSLSTWWDQTHADKEPAKGWNLNPAPLSRTLILLLRNHFNLLYFKSFTCLFNLLTINTYIKNIICHIFISN